MTDYVVSNTSLSSVADAIREKGGTSEPLEFPDGFVTAIVEISGGGGHESVTFSVINAFRFVFGDVNTSTGALTSSTKKMRPNGPIRLLKGDIIKRYNTAMTFAVYKYGTYEISSFTGSAKSESTSDFEVAETGYYLPVARFSNNATVTASDRPTFMDGIVIQRTITDGFILSKNGNPMPDNYMFPFGSSGTEEGSYGTVRGVNCYNNRCISIPFYISEDAEIVVPNEYMCAVYTFASLDTRNNVQSSGWRTGSLAIPEGRYICLALGKSEGAFTMSEITTLLGNIQIRAKKAETGEYNVRTYGAAGDGVTDDTQAIQDALDMCEENGGSVLFPHGTYLITSPLIVHSDTNIRLDGGATVMRGGECNMVFVSHCEAATLGYSGAKNITITGGVIDLGTGISQGGCAIGLIHCDTVRIRDVTMYHANAGYHFVDICGCANVRIDNCVFANSLSDSPNAEFIQFDSAGGYTSFPSVELQDGDTTFDGTPTVDVDVRGCRFELNSYSPAFGNHNADECKNIFVHDCVITGTGGDRGAVAFDHSSRNNITTQVVIHNNIFEGCTYGFDFRADSAAPGRIYVRDNIFKDIGTLKKNPDSPVGVFDNNIEIGV